MVIDGEELNKCIARHDDVCVFYNLIFDFWFWGGYMPAVATPVRCPCSNSLEMAHVCRQGAYRSPGL